MLEFLSYSLVLGECFHSETFAEVASCVALQWYQEEFSELRLWEEEAAGFGPGSAGEHVLMGGSLSRSLSHRARKHDGNTFSDNIWTQSDMVQ